MKLGKEGLEHAFAGNRGAYYGKCGEFARPAAGGLEGLFAEAGMGEFKVFCREFLKERVFDQLISEKEGGQGRSQWMNAGYRHPDGK